MINALQNIEDVLDQYSIPCNPKILNAILEELKQDNPDQDRLGKLLTLDVSIAGAVLQIANDPHMLRSLKVEQPFIAPQVAASSLGLKHIDKLIKKIEQREIETKHHELHFYRFWDSAVDGAIMSAHLAKKIMVGDPEEAYLLGLMRDIGIPILLQVYPDEYQQLLADYERGNYDVPLPQVENDKFGFNHQLVGYALAKRWHLSDVISRGILSQHDLDYHKSPPGTITARKNVLVSIVWIAVMVANRFRNFEHMNVEHGDTEWPQIPKSILENTDMNIADLLQLMDDSLEKMEMLIDERQNI